MAWVARSGPGVLGSAMPGGWRGAMLVAAVALVLGMGVDAASAQSRRPTRPATEPAPSSPTQPAAPPADPGDAADPDAPATAPPAPAVSPGQPAPTAAAPEPRKPPGPSPYLRFSKPKEWTVRVDVTVQSYQDARQRDRLPEIMELSFDSAMVVFPLVPRTGSSEAVVETVRSETGPIEAPVARGFVELNDRVVADTPVLISAHPDGRPLHAGTWRVQWPVLPEHGPYVGRDLELRVELPVLSFNTTFDEQAARKVVWPKTPWPAEVASVFEPYAFVDHDLSADYDTSMLDAQLAAWTEGKDPKSIKPTVLAKWLCGQVVNHVAQVSGNGYSHDTRTGVINGFVFQAPGETLATRRGSPVDLATLLCAVYRRAGLPARLVIGYDERGDGGKTYLDGGQNDPELRVWVEFALFDDVDNTLGWVPVDIAEIRSSSSRLPDNFMDRPLKYFGTHDQLEDVVPLAFHFHPPTSVASHGAPGLWGWRPSPALPRGATQFLRFDLNRTPNRGGR